MSVFCKAPPQRPDFIDGCFVRVAKKAWRCNGSGSGLRNDPEFQAEHFSSEHKDIEPGERCIEYLGESHAYEAGPHVCWPCALVFYTVVAS